MTISRLVNPRLASILFTLSLTLQITACGTGDSLTNAGADINPDPGTDIPANNEPAASDIKLSWIAPRFREDNKTLIETYEIAGYKIYCGKINDKVAEYLECSTDIIKEDGSARHSYTFPNEAPGIYYFALITIDSGGRESKRSTPYEHEHKAVTS